MSTTPKAFVKEIMKQIITNQLGGYIFYENENGFNFYNNDGDAFYFYNNDGDAFYMRVNENTIAYRLPRPTGGYCEASYDLNNFKLNEAMEFFGALLDINIADIVHQNELQANANLNIVNNNQQQEL
ncbi:MAG: hypothetical protein IJT15_03880 [Rickettsiales bacterium]|nr:hypothetical protein [Rickettsiales bacterium]